MLKRKRMITTCSLSSCRIKAEALARVFNSRIWPCTWADRRRAEDSAEEDEEYFEASPVEDEDEDRGRDSSAATVEGRAKLFELLQQHANDDATEVFYDVSEHVESDGGNVSQSVIEDGFQEIQLRDSKSDISKKSVTGDVISSDKVLSTGECPTMPIDSAFENSTPAVATRSYFDDSSTAAVITEEPKTSSFEKEIISLTWDSESSEPNQIEIYPNYSNGFLNEENANKEADVPQDITGILNDNETQDTDINLKNIEEKSLTSDTKLEKLNGFEFDKEEILTVLIDSESCTINQTEVHIDDVINTDNETTADTQRDSQNLDTTHEQETEHESKDTENSVPIELIKSSPPEKNEESHSNIQVSNVGLEIQENSRLHVFTGSRPTISRSTSLKTGKTPPGTPSRKKIVRFADVLGLDLEDVRHIISGDLPTVPSSAFSDLVLPDEDLPSKCNPSTMLELTGKQQDSWENIPQGAIGLNTIYPLFDIPGQQHDFIDRVRNNGVCLENVVISDFNVQCTCRVMNWGFTKKVVARYSMDNWKSSQDINASYVPDSSREGMDSFAFNIFLSQERRNVEFALCYRVNDREHWDNNNGKNYCLGYYSNGNVGQSSGSTSPTWIHQFW